MKTARFFWVLGLMMVLAGAGLFVHGLVVLIAFHTDLWMALGFASLIILCGMGGTIMDTTGNKLSFSRKRNNEEHKLEHEHQMRLLKMRHAYIEKAAEEDPY